jgi:hypothetical protein
MFPDLSTTLIALAGERPTFHSEDDFKFALAWYLASQRPGAAIRLETPFDLPELHGRLDLRYEDSDERVVVELKYKTRQAHFTLAEEDYRLKAHGAQDLGRYDYCRDVWRVENLVRAGRTGRGLAILLTNESAYWSEPKLTSAGRAFSLHESRLLGGVLSWPAGFSSGTTKGREAEIVLRGSYEVAWHDYSVATDQRNGRFYYCVVEAKAGA